MERCVVPYGDAWVRQFAIFRRELEPKTADKGEENRG